jgi:hypothetical protein
MATLAQWLAMVALVLTAQGFTTAAQVTGAFQGESGLAIHAAYPVITVPQAQSVQVLAFDSQNLFCKSKSGQVLPKSVFKIKVRTSLFMKAHESEGSLDFSKNMFFFSISCASPRTSCSTC